MIADDVDGELRALRDRAYGPNADIQDDPAAVKRLRELDQTGRTVTTGQIATEIPEHAAPHPQGTPPSTDVTAQASLKPAAPDLRVTSTADRKRWSLPQLRWMWIGSVVLALILGAILTVLGNGWLTRVGDVHQVGSLREVDDFAWPESLGTETADARGYTEFEGLTVITSEQQWAGIGTDTCMLVVKSADVTLAAPSGGSLYWGCGTSAFPPTVQFEVTAGMPAELKDEFPVGTEIRFVLRTAQKEALGGLQVDVLAHSE